VQAVQDLHTGGHVTLEYSDVDRLVTWLLVVAHHAEHIEEWDLLEDTAYAYLYLYLDRWDRWAVQRDIHAWLASRSGHGASIVASALRRNPEVLSHFERVSLATQRPTIGSDRRYDGRPRNGGDDGFTSLKSCAVRRRCGCTFSTGQTALSTGDLVGLWPGVGSVADATG
jgi:hypothetical protein